MDYNKLSKTKRLLENEIRELFQKFIDENELLKFELDTDIEFENRSDDKPVVKDFHIYLNIKA